MREYEKGGRSRLFRCEVMQPSSAQHVADVTQRIGGIAHRGGGAGGSRLCGTDGRLGGLRSGVGGVSDCVLVPKSDLRMPSHFDRIPGIEYSEREMREMLGVEFEGLPMKGFIFLPENWDENVKPWRRDKDGLNPDMMRDLS